MLLLLLLSLLFLLICQSFDPSRITELIIKKDKSLVDEQKEDGFTALHVAAINNHTDVMKILFEKGNAKVDLRTQKKQTALHVAAEQAYMDAVQLLIQHGRWCLFCFVFRGAEGGGGHVFCCCFYSWKLFTCDDFRA